MGDFYSIDLKDDVEKFNWEPIEAKGDLPGPRSKHALVGTKNSIYLIGGLYTDVRSSSKIYCFNPESATWTLQNPVGESLPEIDSFGCVYLEKDGDELIIIVGGWDGAKAEYLNSVYEFNITKNKVSILFEGSQEPQQGTVLCYEGTPVPRSGCTAATDGKNVFMFGGKDAENRMNDLWEFNMVNFKFSELEKTGDIPPERNGHTMEYFEGKLYVFGGIHDITWELDDLHIYNLDKKKWTTLEQDSPRKIEKKREGN